MGRVNSRMTFSEFMSIWKCRSAMMGLPGNGHVLLGEGVFISVAYGAGLFHPATNDCY